MEKRFLENIALIIKGLNRNSDNSYVSAIYKKVLFEIVFYLKLHHNQDDVREAQSAHICLARGFGLFLLGVMTKEAKKMGIKDVKELGKAGILNIMKEYIEKDEN